MFAVIRAFVLGATIPSIITLGVAEEDAPAVLSSYHVSTNVKSRLAITSIDMVFENPNENCSDTRSLSLPLPKNARVTDLSMDLSDGCALNGTVKSLEEAVRDFELMAGRGKAAALLTAWDVSKYDLRVSVPPNGTTAVTLEYQELLARRLDRVDFRVPFHPGTSVRRLELDISVEDSFSRGAGDLTLVADDAGAGIKIVPGKDASTARYLGTEVPSDSSLPALLPVYFRPGPLPDDGVMLADGDCFTHIFNPSMFLSTAGRMPRKIVFVIDVSGSMDGRKLDEAKSSFSSMIDTLDERDTLIVQPFASRGTEDLWGPSPANSSNKAEAKEFVAALQTRGSTNLRGAFLDGIANVHDVPEEWAPLLVILTDGRGNVGPQVTARSVLDANEGGRVKIFSLAFGSDADMDLLQAVAVQNGGKAVRIYEGFGDAVSQMTQFYKQELGTVMLSEIDVSYDFEDSILESTIQRFPVLASGAEIVVRGRLNSPALSADRVLRSTINAKSAVGPQKWFNEFSVIQDDSAGSDCLSSFAQARIVELLEYRDSERAVGSELFDGSAGAGGPSFEDRAREVALDARLVWPGLTALVTLENTSCRQNTYGICKTSEGFGDGDAGDDGAGEGVDAAFAAFAAGRADGGADAAHTAQWSALPMPADSGAGAVYWGAKGAGGGPSPYAADTSDFSVKSAPGMSAGHAGGDGHADDHAGHEYETEGEPDRPEDTDAEMYRGESGNGPQWMSGSRTIACSLGFIVSSVVLAAMILA